MLKLDDLKVHGLSPLSMELHRGECLAVQGPSGSGKSLLLRAMADLDPVSGSISLNGKKQCDMSGSQWRSAVRYFAAEPGWWLETPRPHFPENCPFEQMIKDLGLGSELLDRAIARLSTGERQRLGIARGLCGEPELLLLDEPTAALDEEAESLVEALIVERSNAGAMVIIVTHRKEQADRLAHRRLILENGTASLVEAS